MDYLPGFQRVDGWCKSIDGDNSVSFLSRTVEDCCSCVGGHGCPVIMAKNLSEF